MKDDAVFKKLLIQYQQSSYVRMWITDKKKNLSRKLEKKHNQDYIAELKQKKKTAKAKKESAEKEKDQEAASEKDKEEKKED